jgi:hypothetical protein
MYDTYFVDLQIQYKFIKKKLYVLLYLYILIKYDIII